MQVINLVKIFAEIMKLMSNYDIKAEDYKFIDLFSDYSNMVNDGLKVSYVVSVLSEKYNISEASVYRILRKFKRTIRMG